MTDDNTIAVIVILLSLGVITYHSCKLGLHRALPNLTINLLGLFGLAVVGFIILIWLIFHMTYNLITTGKLWNDN